jgi:hypothetical protein
MASVSAFNEMMANFIGELGKAFPEEKGIKKFETSFDLLRKSNPRKIVETYMAGIGPYAERITARDETLLDEDIGFLKDLNMKANWSRASEGTRGAIFQYLQTLYMLGVTITSIPADTLKAIEGLAQDCASKMQQGGEGGGGIDQGALMNMLGGLLKK